MAAHPDRLAQIVKANDVRGRVHDQLDDEVAFAFGAAFPAVTQARRVLVGRDMRAHSATLCAAFARGAASRGADVVDLGLCATDELYFATGRLDLPGAVFTPSHNPADYGGMKFSRAGALPMGAETGLPELAALAGRLLAGEIEAAPAAARPGAVESMDLLADYAGYLRCLVDLDGIRPLTVVIDAGNGMAGLTAPAVFAGTAVTVVPLYFELDGTFPNHDANPLVPENLRDLQAAVVGHAADAGLAFDGDADRCFVVDADGDAVSPSAINALIATRELARRPGASVIHNLITSRVVPEVVREHGGTPVRTRVGHSFIKAEMARTGAVFGGEHSAHYYFQDFWGADSGMLAALHVLATLGRSDRPLAELAARYDRYTGSGEINSTVDDQAAALARVAGLGAELTALAGQPGRPVAVDRLDGLTLEPADPDRPHWWVNVRPSNTEPLVRLNVEAADATTMQLLRDRALAAIRTH